MLSDTQSTAIQQLIHSFESNNSPGMALGIIHKGAFVFQQCVGLANLEDRIPITSHTVFEVGAMAKQFTAACLALLIEQGKVDLEDNIAPFFPQMPNYGHTIQLQHLVYHTSGLPDYLELAHLKGLGNDAHYDSDFALKLVFSQPHLAFLPGEEERYCNTNYLLIGQIIQSISGLGLRQFAAHHIFDPLKMHQTFFQDNAHEVIPNRAIGYSVSETQHSEVFPAGINVIGDGGLRTSLDDLLQWDQNFYQNKLGQQTESFNRLLLRPGSLNDGTRFDYGFGLILSDYCGMPTQRHGGVFAGFCAEMIRFPNAQLSIICLSNQANMTPWTLVEQVAAIVFDLEPKANSPRNNAWAVDLQPATDLPEELLEQYVGYYDLGAASPLEVIKKEGALLLRYGAEEELLIVPKTSQVFVEPSYNITIKFFNFDSKGAPFLLFKTPEQEIIAAKVLPPNQTIGDLNHYQGNYYCASLKVVYCLFIEDNLLYLSIDFAPAIPLYFSEADFAETGLGIIHFFRDNQNQVNGFWLNTEHIHHLEFKKLHQPQHSHE